MFFQKFQKPTTQKPQSDPDERVPSWIPIQNPSKTTNTEYFSKRNGQSH